MTRRLRHLLIAGLLAALSAPGNARGQSDPGSSAAISLGEEKKFLLVPSLAIQRQVMEYGDTPLEPTSEVTSAIELGLRLITASNQNQTLLFGFDLRQLLAHTKRGGQSFAVFDVLETRLGMRAEWHPHWPREPSIAANWFFGDTFVVRHRDRQFNGTSFTISASVRLRHVTRAYIELSSGSYTEGAGFIYRGQPPGEETLSTRAISFGLSIPFEFDVTNHLLAPRAEPDDHAAHPPSTVNTEPVTAGF